MPQVGFLPAKSSAEIKRKDKEIVDLDLVVGCKTGWVRHGIILKDGDSVIFPTWRGSVQMGHGPGTTVDATGKFENGDIRGPADGDYPVEGLNKYCALVGLTQIILGTPIFAGSKPFFLFYSKNVPNWGATVGDAGAGWELPERTQGEIVTCFNDNNDDDNDGQFILHMQIIRA